MSACPNCGHENLPEGKFCSECGTRLAGPPPARQERKVVSVLFADLVGFTSRAEQLDPEDVHALLTPYHARVKSELERFGGTVEKFIGDAIMALFGATAAHEDDPERAVRAALAIRDWVEEEPDLQVRIGITTGEALISLDARPEAGEGMASGDVVNTAARLQTAAPVGGILVDQTTYRATDRVIGYAQVDPVEAKGKAEPVVVWRPVEALSRLGVDVRQHGGAALVGRGRELQVLTDALIRVKERAEPELITLVGVPGIGKSRLVYELLQEVDRESDLVTWRQGRSLPYGEGVTFWALGEMVKAQAGILETDGAEETESKLQHATHAVLSEPTEAERILRYLRPLVGLGTPGQLGQDRGQAFAAWRRFLEALAAERPLVLIFEDLHWADDNLLDFADYLLDWASGAPMLVIGTARPELLARRAGWGGGKPNATTLSLRALSDTDTTALVRSLLDRAVVPADVQAEVLARAGGNPLYAEEFARMVAERVGKAATREQLLPESIQGIIAARLDALPPAEKALLQAASVVGKLFWRGSLEQITGVSSADLDEPLHALERKEFIGREPRSSVAGEDEYMFRHVLMRDVAYSQIPRAGRAEKHRQAAAWIESLGAERAEDRAEMLVHHYASALEFATAAAQPTDELVELAAAALRDAGERALGLNAPAAAAGFYARALELVPADHVDRPELLFGRATALHVAGDDERIPALEEACDALLAADNHERAAQAEQMLGQAWWLRACQDEALAHQQRAVDLLGADRSSTAAVRVLAYSARLKVLAGEGEEALAIAREILPHADALGLDLVRSQLATTIGMARKWLGDEGGMEDLERGRELALAAGELVEAARATQNLASFIYEAGEIGRAYALARDSLELAKQAGAMGEVRYQEEVLATGGYDAGSWDDAATALDRFIADSERSPSVEEGEMRVTRAEIRLARGEVELAVADVSRAVELARQINEPQVVLLALATAARIHAELGRVEQAHEFAAELMAHPASRPIPAYRDFAWVAAGLGQTEALRDKLLSARDESKFAAAMLAVVDGSFAEAAERFSEMGLRPDEADARLRAGRELVTAGHFAEAQEQLRRAIDYYREQRASRYLEQAEALLAAARGQSG
ncbi:MAG: adenylate/guanylate cyclase domain-containing protein [Chloroflexota bacterium]